MLVACGWSLPEVGAQLTVVGNLAQPWSTAVAIGKPPGGSFDFSTGVSFTTGAALLDFTGVVLSMDNAFGTPSGLSVSLFSTMTATGPIGLVAVLGGSTAPVVAGQYAYTVPVTALSPATTYWLVATAPTTPADTYFRINLTGSTLEDAGAAPGWSVGDLRWLTNDGGANWFSVAGQIPQFSVQVTGIPEPATHFLLLGGALALAGIRRLRRSKLRS